MVEHQCRHKAPPVHDDDRPLYHFQGVEWLPFATMDIDHVVFVYRHTFTGNVRAAYLDDSGNYDKHPDYKHIGTLDPKMWIQHTLNSDLRLADQMEGIDDEEG